MIICCLTHYHYEIGQHIIETYVCLLIVSIFIFFIWVKIVCTFSVKIEETFCKLELAGFKIIVF